MQKFIKYFLKNKAVTWLLLVLILAGGLFSYAKMGKLEDAPFTIKQALHILAQRQEKSTSYQPNLNITRCRHVSRFLCPQALLCRFRSQGQE